VSAVQRAPFRAWTTLVGRVTAERLESFRVPMVPNWRVTVKWLVDEGTPVKSGDPIARFDTGSLQNEYDAAENTLNDKLAENALADAQAAADLLDKRLTVERTRIEQEKAAVEAAVPPEIRAQREHEDKQLALEKAKSAATTAQGALDAAKEKNRTEAAQREIDADMAREKLERVSKQLEAMTLVAHQAGLAVLELNWRTGKRMKPGDQTWSTAPIAYIPDPAATKVQAFAGEAELVRLAVGQPATLSLDAYPERRFHGKVTAIARAGEPNEMWGKSPFYAVDISIEDPDAELMKQGMSVRAEVLVADEPDALVVPLAALRPDGENVAVRSAGKTIPVRVRATNAFDAALEPSAELPAGAPLDDAPFGMPPEAESGTDTAPRTDKVVAQGTLTSRVKDSLSPSVPNMWRFSITELAPEGQQVAAGTVVVAFDPKELTDKLALTQAQLSAARKELEKTVLEGQQTLEQMQLQLAESKMKLDKAERKLDVPAELIGGVQHSVEKYDAELAQMEFDLNQRRVETARANLEARRSTQESKIARLSGELQQTQSSIEAMRIKAPRSGCVVYVVEDEQDGKPRIGAEVWRGREVLEIADLSQMEVDARVPEPDAGRVHLGQRAEIRLDANPDKLFTGRVTELGRVFHTKSQETPSIVFDATVSIDNPDSELMRPGMAAEVTILSEGPA
jgi:HlyD family secretion protein